MRERWSDEQLWDAVGVAASWPGLFEALGVEDTTNERRRVRRHARALGLDLGGLSRGRPLAAGAPIEVPVVEDIRANLSKGAVCIVAAWLTLRGFRPSLPAKPGAKELFVSTPGGIRRIHVEGPGDAIGADLTDADACEPDLSDSAGGIRLALDGEGALFLLHNGIRRALGSVGSLLTSPAVA